MGRMQPMWRIRRYCVLDGCVDKYLAKGYNVVRELRSERKEVRRYKIIKRDRHEDDSFFIL